MAEINKDNERLLDHKTLKQYLSYDKDTGIFMHLIPRVGVSLKKPAGSKTADGYWRIRLFGKEYKAHRLAWFYSTGEFPNGIIDHIDRNKLNNSLNNLRLSTVRLNSHNRSDNVSKVGAYFNKNSNTWTSQIQYKGTIYYLGSFSSEDEAHNEYMNMIECLK